MKDDSQTTDYQEKYLFLTRNLSKISVLEKIKEASEEVQIIRIFIAGERRFVDQFSDLKKEFPCIFLAHSINGPRLPSVCVHTGEGNLKSFRYISQLALTHQLTGGLNTKEIDGRKIGTIFETENERQLYLCGFQDYESVDEVLKSQNFSPQDLFRHWNFIEDINHNYEGFNQLRDAYFQKHKITDFPAATGIEADLEGQKLSLNFEGIQSNEVEIKDLKSDLQPDASSYGPKFSRGKVLTFSQFKKVYISGTSSVDWDGKSIFQDDPERNVDYVLDCVGHLLQKEGTDFNDIVFSIVYCKNEKYFDIFLQIYKSKNWRFPFIPLCVNICREDLFFEMECVAIKNH